MLVLTANTSCRGCPVSIKASCETVSVTKQILFGKNKEKQFMLYYVRGILFFT